ncbi:hypothetical protein PUMCH_000224 [Australozyma saopauloensis]|uniref:AN1-type domain-containing protein n=1 Tax=Australozyma saopauloensis TaxID=291208 RepID=A0AAX4H479_9ASCO|nr:hypothetical protein PUMCH_000224 [[Candida] saopauloensis]
MKVIFRLSTEVSFSMTVPENSTVADLRNAAVVGCPLSAKLPGDFKLIFNGTKLAPHNKLFESFGASGECVTVIIMSEAVTTPVASPQLGPTMAAPKKKLKKNRCTFTSCSSTPLRIVGDCGHCLGKFCAKHRLLEDHLCTGLQFCKEVAHERNAIKLQNESTITSRV